MMFDLCCATNVMTVQAEGFTRSPLLYSRS